MTIRDGKSKYCPDCRKELAVEQFTKNIRSSDGFAFYCAPCARRRHVASRRLRLGPPKSRNGQGPIDMPVDSKWCPECDEVKLRIEFPRNRSQAAGIGTYCRPCHNQITRRDKEKHGGARNYHLRRRYGISAGHADRMFAEQRGLCAICGERPAAHVDHDHATGRVRGLLCFNCNGALGQFRDRPDLMTRAIAYLTMGAGSVGRGETGSYVVRRGPDDALADSRRPEGEDSAYLFDYLDSIDPAA